MKIRIQQRGQRYHLIEILPPTRRHEGSIMAAPIGGLHSYGSEDDARGVLRRFASEPADAYFGDQAALREAAREADEAPVVDRDLMPLRAGAEVQS